METGLYVSSGTLNTVHWLEWQQDDDDDVDDVDDVAFLVQRAEHVRITDFGLAKLLNNKQSLFSTTGEKVMMRQY